MKDILFTLPGFGPVKAWGTFLYLGFCLSMWVGARRMKQGGITGRHMLYIGTIALVGGILGGKILYAVQYRSAGPGGFAGQGMVSFGGWALGIGGVLLYLKLRGLPVLRVSDMLAPSLAVGEAVGRIGCFLNGCCYGDICTMPWGASFPQETGSVAVPFNQFFDGLDLASQTGHQIIATYPYPALHPTQLYSTLAAAIIFLALLWWSKRKRFDGEVALAFGLLYSASRFIIELWRNDTPALQTGLSMGQTFSALLFACCLGVLVYFHCRSKP